MFKENSETSLPSVWDEEDLEEVVEATIGAETRSGFNREPENFWMPAGIICVVLSLVIALVLFFGLIIRKKDPKSGFAKWWKEFLNFRKIWVAGIMKFTYVLCSLLATFGGIAMMIYGFYEGREQGLMLLVGLGIIVLGNILLRLTFEMSMIFIGLWENTADMREALVGAKQRVEAKRAAAEEAKKEE